MKSFPEKNENKTEIRNEDMFYGEKYVDCAATVQNIYLWSFQVLRCRENTFHFKNHFF